ncbi:MAG: hypothetical protein MPN21_27655 [Thermoanaerobaculia bacterium]|nr:hypothetical protein [Thermoanaerobaculia bacterium]
MEAKHYRDHLLASVKSIDLILQGRAEAAIASARRSYEVAVEVGDENLVGAALSDLGSAFVLAGRGEETVSTLADWLSSSSDPYVSFRLSQSLANHYRFLEEPDLAKHKRYSSQAYDHAERTSLVVSRACARHEIGYAFLAEASFQAAQELFYDALRLLRKRPERSIMIPPYLATLGFSLSQSGDHAEGVRVLCHSVGMARSEGVPSNELPPRIYLASAMLDMRRPRDAEFHLRVALRLDRFVSLGASWAPKILHLLGDALKMQRRSREAFDIFRKLQTDFYPEQEGLAEILMEVEARRRIAVL